jgi:CRP-like cAMP-binding protein
MPNSLKIVDFRIFSEVSSEKVSYKASETIISPDIDNKSMYIIEKGSASIFVNGHFVTEISQGSIFGELGLVDPQPHTATIISLTEITLYKLSESQFLRLVAIHPIFALRVMRVIAQRVRAMNHLLTKQNNLLDFSTVPELHQPTGGLTP